MVRENPFSQRFIMNIAIQSKEDKRPALDRVEDAFSTSDVAFSGSDDAIRQRVIDLVKFVQSRHYAPSRIVGVSDSNARIRLRTKVADFIVRDLPGYRSGLQKYFSEQLDPIEADRRDLE